MPTAPPLLKNVGSLCKSIAIGLWYNGLKDDKILNPKRLREHVPNCNWCQERLAKYLEFKNPSSIAKTLMKNAES